MNTPTTTHHKAEAIMIAQSIIERIESNRLTQVPLLHLDELPAISGLYFATTDEGDILYIGKADDLTQRCKLSQHHKLPLAIERGATVLQVARVDDGLAWAVEQKLIAQLAPPLNDAVSLWWMAADKKASRAGKSLTALSRRSIKLSLESWQIAEAISRYRRFNNPKVALESAIRNYSDRLMSDDPSFVQVLNKVKAEGVESDRTTDSEATTND